MALHGSQKKFDKNGDGRLNTREWQNWYLRTYGLDIEREERQKASQREAGWDEWKQGSLRGRLCFVRSRRCL